MSMTAPLFPTRCPHCPALVRCEDGPEGDVLVIHGEGEAALRVPDGLASTQTLSGWLAEIHSYAYALGLADEHQPYQRKEHLQDLVLFLRLSHSGRNNYYNDRAYWPLAHMDPEHVERVPTGEEPPLVSIPEWER
jgi:hypothetical protein